MGLATEAQIKREGYESFKEGKTDNPYLRNTWAYEAWAAGYQEAFDEWWNYKDVDKQC